MFDFGCIATCPRRHGPRSNPSGRRRVAANVSICRPSHSSEAQVHPSAERARSHESPPVCTGWRSSSSTAQVKSPVRRRSGLAATERWRRDDDGRPLPVVAPALWPQDFGSLHQKRRGASAKTTPQWSRGATAETTLRRCGATLRNCCCGSRDVAASHSVPAVASSRSPKVG